VFIATPLLAKTKNHHHINSHLSDFFTHPWNHSCRKFPLFTTVFQLNQTNLEDMLFVLTSGILQVPAIYNRFSIKSNQPCRYAFCPDVWHPVTKCKQNAPKKAQADYCQKVIFFFENVTDF